MDTALVPELLLTHAQVLAIVELLADDLAAQYGGRRPLHVIAVREGGTRTAEALEPRLAAMGVEVRDTVKVSSYRGTGQSEALVFEESWTQPVAGRDVLLIEDIIDSGDTIRALAERLVGEGAASVSVCALLVREGRLAAVRADSRFARVCVGWEVPLGKFVYGFGMDVDGDYRELDEIWAV